MLRRKIGDHKDVKSTSVDIVGIGNGVRPPYHIEGCQCLRRMERMRTDCRRCGQHTQRTGSGLLKESRQHEELQRTQGRVTVFRSTNELSAQ